MLDFDVAVHSDDPDLIDLVNELYEPLAVPGLAHHALVLGQTRFEDRPGYFAALDGCVIVRSPARSVVFSHFLFEANQQAIERSSNLIRLHAAGAVMGDRTIVLPGPMGAGKSTLVAGLVRSGLGYVTDEVVAIDPGSGRIRAYPKPISLGAPPDSLGPIHWGGARRAHPYLGLTGVIPAATLGATLAPPETSLGLVVLPRYEPSASTEVVRLSGADALAAVASHAFHLDQGATLVNLAALVADVPCYRIVSGELTAAVDAVLEIATTVIGPS